jgi:hypothetical protein
MDSGITCELCGVQFNDELLRIAHMNNVHDDGSGPSHYGQLEVRSISDPVAAVVQEMQSSLIHPKKSCKARSGASSRKESKKRRLSLERARLESVMAFPVRKSMQPKPPHTPAVRAATVSVGGLKNPEPTTSVDSFVVDTAEKPECPLMGAGDSSDMPVVVSQPVVRMDVDSFICAYNEWPEGSANEIASHLIAELGLSEEQAKLARSTSVAVAKTRRDVAHNIFRLLAVTSEEHLRSEITQLALQLSASQPDRIFNK